MTRKEILNDLLGFVAAFVDTTGFIALSGLFTAHVTGNFVLMGVSIATGAGGDIAKALTVPVFLVLVALTCVLVDLLEARGRKPLVPVLVLEFVLLAVFLGTGLRLIPLGAPDDLATLVVSAAGVAAMAVQNALMRRVLHDLTATTVMTSTLTQVAVDATELLTGGERAVAGRARLQRMLPVVIAFAAGAATSGLSYLAMGFVSLVVPLAVLAVAIVVASRIEA